MNPISLGHLHKLLLPSPHSHWSATGPRSKIQPTTTRNTQRKATRNICWQPKPVSPVSETGQTDLLGLSLSQAGETGQAGLANQSGRFHLGNPQKTFKTKHALNTSRTSPPLNKKSHSMTETLLLKSPHDSPLGLNRSDRFRKKVRPVLPGQSRRTQPAGKPSLDIDRPPEFVPRIQVRLWG
jgi:hypothetical protein